MRMHKRGSLSLSVNAIVVFILALGMLGVGLFFINKVRQGMDVPLDRFIPADMMTNPATSDTPLTVEGALSMKRKGQINTQIGFYNRDGTEITGVRFFFTECTSTSTGDSLQRTTDEGGVLSLAVICKPDGGSNCGTTPDGGWKLPKIVTSTAMQFPSGEGKGVPAIINADEALDIGTHMCTIAATEQQSSNYKVKGTTSFQIEILP